MVSLWLSCRNGYVLSSGWVYFTIFPLHNHPFFPIVHAMGPFFESSWQRLWQAAVILILLWAIIYYA